MTERPIIFGAPMIRAVLDGKKTQTRRIAKLPDDYPEFYVDEGGTEVGPGPYLKFPATETQIGHKRLRCPYGYHGDRLWVKEGHAIRSDVDPKVNVAKARQYLIYRTDHDGDLGFEWHHYGRWRPSIHMPRWASRITLELTDVRVQRVQDISEDDACAEGVDGPHYGRWTDMTGAVVPPLSEPARPWAHSFAVAWREVHRGDDASWFTNPWVWALTFKRVEQPR